ncbi:hypothetical protein UFOVP417_20 [uncultured Caudovirales phage]|jgi:hypothetical protein|uniref:Uncharacterized protein n=1 Tax=uncultured Caudovirales phage TaxID=2100421 RepID=A0A6J5M3S2_9CAUD|nr:hypothetical protein UFOVP417_20 [uncultured Caudovirales phage]
MNNPFDLENYKPTISFADLEKARKSAYQASHIVNEKRKQGIEPSVPYGARASGVPQDYTTEMPVMPMHKRTAQKKRRQDK